MIPDESGVLPFAGGKGVAGPGFAFNDFIIDLIAIELVHTIDMDAFFFIGAHFVVYHHIEQHGDTVLVQGLDGLMQLVFGAVFGGDRSFLIELTQIKQIVSVVADGMLAFTAFTGGREPDHGDTDIIKGCSAFSDLRP